MSELPERVFANPVWHALRTLHRHFAISNDSACRYPALVAPFLAVVEPSETALRKLSELLTPDESAWLVGAKFPNTPELVFEEALDCLQMVLPEHIALPGPTAKIIPLSNSNATEMVALTDVAFPGFFKSRTCEMGSYFGVRSETGTLIAMGGERLKLEGYPEISGLCTHPAHRGKGLAVSLLQRLVEIHRRQGLKSWLHVTCHNHNAIKLYQHLGFNTVRTVTLHRVRLKP